MKKILVTGIIALSTVTIMGCGSEAASKTNETAVKAVEQAELALANMEYDKAIASFNLAIEKGDTDEKNKAVKLIIEQYLEAEKLFKEGLTLECHKVLSDIDLGYKNLSIAKDIDELKEMIKEPFLDEPLEEEVGAEKKEEVKTEKKKEESKSSNKDILSQKKSEYLDALAYTQNDVENIGIGSGDTNDLKEASGAELKLWDDKLNEIYTCLRTYMPSGEFEKLKQEQINWIKYRDQTADAAEASMAGGSGAILNRLGSLATTTRERCYELVNNYM